MAANLLITGYPGCGKSTVLSQTADRLEAAGLTVGGLISPAMTTLGSRVGFRIEDLATDEGEVMAHVDHREGPRVGKYRVDVEAVDRISELSLAPAREEGDVILIDETAPMEVFSEVFIEEARVCLAAIHRTAADEFIGEVEWPAGHGALVTREAEFARPDLEVAPPSGRRPPATRPETTSSWCRSARTTGTPCRPSWPGAC